jgi:hypothetical protein
MFKTVSKDSVVDSLANPTDSTSKRVYQWGISSTSSRESPGNKNENLEDDGTNGVGYAIEHL